MPTYISIDRQSTFSQILSRNPKKYTLIKNYSCNLPSLDTKKNPPAQSHTASHKTLFTAALELPRTAERSAARDRTRTREQTSLVYSGGSIFSKIYTLPAQKLYSDARARAANKSRPLQPRRGLLSLSLAFAERKIAARRSSIPAR